MRVPRTPEGILAIVHGFRATAILRAGVELGAFEALARGAAFPGAVARRIRCDPRGTTILLEALAALGLLRARAGRFSLAPAARRWLVPGRPGYLGDAARLSAADFLWEALRRLPEAVRRGRSALKRPGETPEHPFWRSFSAWSEAYAGPAAEALEGILRPWLARLRAPSILDIACGSGLYGFTLARRHPRARVHSLDGARVLAVARRRARRLGILRRVRFLPGDAFRRPLGGPHDLVVVSHLLHHFSASRCGVLLRRLAATLRPGGRLAIHEFVPRGGDPARDPFPRLFSAVMLAWTRGGAAHPLPVYRRLLARAGLSRPRVHPSAALPGTFLVAENRGGGFVAHPRVGGGCGRG